MKRNHTHSQHFLRSPRFVQELIGHSSLKRSDVVYDIGAGSGVITSVLATRAGQVIAIELEPSTAKLLRKNMANYQNVTIIEKDFLTMTLPETPYKVFANIPFHISSEILRKLTEAPNPPSAAYLIVQKQFAKKLLPEHEGFSSQLGMTLGAQFAFRVRKPLRRTDFWPHPNVDTVFLEVLHREEYLVPKALLSQYAAFIKKHFTSPDAFHRLPLTRVGASQESKASSLTLLQWTELFLATR